MTVDPTSQICDETKSNRQIAENAAEEFFANMENPYFKTRKAELKEVLVRIILGANYLMNGD